MRFITMAAVIAVLALGGGFALAACGDGGDDAGGAYGGNATTATPQAGDAEGTTTSPPPAVPTIAIRDGEPTGGVEELAYKAGEEVRFKVRSDVAGEIHVHGYDLTKNVAAGGTVAFFFPADLEGIFEVELEERAEQIAELRVEP